MSARLKYRLPGKSTVALTGDFHLLNGDVPEGFVVTSFDGTEVYQFQDNLKIDVTPHTRPVVWDHKAYLKAASALISDLKVEGGKVVLSRIQADPFQSEIDHFYQSLCDHYPNAFVYLIQSNNLGTWIGATPETLIFRDGSDLKSMALAGTRRTGEAKDWTQKEYDEHEFVADFIEEQVKRFNPQEFDRSERIEANSGPVKHLRTDFRWKTPSAYDWEIATKLHPTPAVSGWPVDSAIDKIKKYEAHNRSLYTGVIGLVGSHTQLFVNLRCAQIVDDEIFLYLGGGFTKDSMAQDEWIETENKAATLRNVLKKV